jgi:phenylalanyl-tRNA synthetase alpha chain
MKAPPNQRGFLVIRSSSTIEEIMADQTTLHTIQEIVHQVQTQFATDQTDTSLDLKTKYLGKKGEFNRVAQLLKEVAPTDKKEAGQLLNELKTHLETQISETMTAQSVNTTWVDLTAPGIKPKVGHVHPISQAMAEITTIFERIGFTRSRYPEVDWDWYVFESLNMPPDHPARDEWETFFVDLPDTTKNVAYDPNSPRDRHPEKIGGKIVLTAHTSNGQVREMERIMKDVGEPPIRMINIARCYRRQQDVTHTQMFHQFEGLVVDKGITIQHLKGTLDYFAQEFYGPGTKSRIRPFHFQFTEPSFEVDFSCHICGGTGELKDETSETGVSKCRFCKSGWHEVGGAGMVHPNVLKAGGIDPTVYTGFAFGWGIERTYTLKEGLNIDDIRLLYSGDLRFLEQF